ncbi:MAG: DUF3301 domain-containing protein [Phycisphaerales bacterium]|nr:DUF3301 domain-containing protein [Phycisphaerales bacterium]
MSFFTLVGILAVMGLGLWFWRDSLGAREQARSASARVCQRSGVQLLDDTVALERLWLRRDRDGRFKLERLYVFEFTDTGLRRQVGSVLLVGWRVEVVQMEGDDLLLP